MVPPVMDNSIMAHVLLDQFEGRIGAGQNGFRWDGQAWIGTDYDKLWLKVEGFASGNGRVEDGRHELLYDRAISTYVDLQAGVRTDWDSATGRNWAAFGVQGLAPFFVQYEATGYVSDRGHAALRLAVSYDLLLTQRLILQPEVEVNFYCKADPGRRHRRRSLGYRCRASAALRNQPQVRALCRRCLCRTIWSDRDFGAA